MGQQAVGSPTPYTHYLTLASSAWASSNVGVDGETLAMMLANYPTIVAPLKQPGGKNVVVIWGGTNDISVSNTTPAATYAILANYISAAHASGFKVIVPTMLSRLNQDANKNSYNALILANSGGADAIADFTGTALGCNGCYASATWFNADGIHPTTIAINQIEAAVISNAVAALP